MRHTLDLGRVDLITTLSFGEYSLRMLLNPLTPLLLRRERVLLL